MFKTIHECRLDLVAHTTLPLVVDEFTFQTNADDLPASAARASFGKEDKTGDDPAADFKLMKYLASHQHMTPFEYQTATFLIECPLFIRSQIHRHRTFTFNEISRRYTSEQLEFWVPDSWRKQSKSNKQASTDEQISLPLDECRQHWKEAAHSALSKYHMYLEGGLCREQARAVLPQSLLTRFYAGGNLRNWVHFLKLRLDPHAQYEVRVVAERIEAKLRELWPKSMEALMGEAT